MKRLLFLSTFVLSTFLLSASERIKLSNFHEISVSGSVEVVLVKGVQEYVDFEMIRGDEDKFHAEVKNGKLSIYLDKEFLWTKSAKAKVTVSYRSIDKLSASAGSWVKSDAKIKTPNFAVNTSSGATINIPVEATTLNGQSSSGSILVLSGDVESAKLTSSSGATLDAGALKSETAKAQSSSGAWIGIGVKDHLEAHASSGGSIKYKAASSSCRVDKDTSSGGSISKL
ncbi:MAG: DUF2807 domain-containing protein [Saprospiraceae bacterium]|nr:DUF2807 domain-containing protein [Saprospiraceae bacterium]